jgi:peptidoglycan/LPS O-acetylase OafA/YrhL
MFVPQGWTLALELLFYAFVPLVVRFRTGTLLVLTLALFYASYRVTGEALGRNVRFDDLAFFPTTARYFLLGVLSHRIYAGLPESFRAGRIAAAGPILPLLLGGAAILALCWLAFGYGFVRAFEHQGYAELYLAMFLMYGTLALLLPFLFILGNRFRADRWLGEYSYPIYLFHYPIAKWAEGAMPSWSIGLATVVLTLGVCTVFIVLLDRPLQGVRARVARLAAGRAGGPAWPAPAAEADRRPQSAG